MCDCEQITKIYDKAVTEKVSQKVSGAPKMSKKTKPLDPRADLFCSCYTAVGTPTFNHKEASAVAAGFSQASARNQATKLLKQPAIQQRLDELKAANRQRNNVSVDSVVENLTHDRDSARAKGDWQAAIRADELLGKIVGCFVDRQSFETPEHRIELDERERQEALAIAAIRLRMLTGGEDAAVKMIAGERLDGEGLTPQAAGGLNST